MRQPGPRLRAGAAPAACRAAGRGAGPNLWPDLPGFREPVAACYAATADLARRLFRGFALALGLPEDHFEPHRTHPPSQLRLIHYPFDPADAPDQQGTGAHTDYEFFTILHGSAAGLEVMNGEGAWIDAPPLDGFEPAGSWELLQRLDDGTERRWRIDTLLAQACVASATPADPAATAWLAREADTLLAAAR